MPDKFQNKYRIPSARLQNWDYGWNGAYFITICSQKHEHFFGEIEDGEMHLNEIGILAEKYWHEIPAHFPFIETGNFVVMPIHVHGILTINKPDNLYPLHTAAVETPNLGVSTTIADKSPNSDPAEKKQGGKNEKWKPATIGVIMNQYKRIVTIQARKIHADFAWQSRFHDHIIRDEIAFNRISNYILHNPANWKNDKFYT